jgi:lysophospholipase L1-like esterase
VESDRTIMVERQTLDRSTRLSKAKRFAFGCVVMCVFAGAVEMVARAVDAWTYVSVEELRRVYQDRRAWRLGEQWPLQRGDYPYLPHVPNPEHPGINELGFRGGSISHDKPTHAYRIFCLGGSTTFDGYPAYLEDELRGDFAANGLSLEVVNAGNDCYNSLDSTINFITRCLPLGPDAIVVYHGINDAVMAFSETHEPDYTHFRKRFTKDDPLFWDRLPGFLDHSAAFVGFRAVFERNAGTRGIAIDISQDVQTGRRRVYHGLEPFRQNLYTLVSVARARGIEVFLGTQVFNREYEYRFHLQRLWADAVDDANDITRSFSGLWENVQVVDAAGSLRGSNDWMRDYCHFTESGKERFAAFMADSIRPHVPRLIERHGDAGRLHLAPSASKSSVSSDAAVPSGGMSLSGVLRSPR